MKYPTSHHELLKENLKKAKLILRGVPQNELKTDMHELKTKAFVLLTHAAFETYFEQLGSDAVRASRKALKKGKISASLVALVVNCVANEISEKSKKSITENIARNLAAFSEEASNQYFRMVQENHGIKNNNLKALLLPVGVDPEEIDVVLWNSLHEFGTLRGEMAHTFQAISNEHTPKILCSKVDSIALAISDLDKAVCDALMITMKF